MIGFPAPGFYQYDRLAIISRPVAQIPASFAALAAESMTDTDLHLNPISRATGEISGNVLADREGVLLVQLPYSKGFRAFVDGEERPVLRTDTMFLSVPVTPGAHSIRLIYRTPGGAAGVCCTLAGIILLILMSCFRHRPK